MKVRVCDPSELPPGGCRVVSAGALEVAVFNVDGDLFAIGNACAHTGGPLVDGLVKDGTVTCPLHWWRFELATGERKGAPHIRQATYPVCVEDGEVFVELPQPAPQVGMRELLLRHAAEWNASHQAGDGG
jgi:nitrite reductase (NADH) small subunit